MRHVTEPHEVEPLAQSIAAAAIVGFDCEFLSQDRLVPQLCLLQLVLAGSGDSGSGGESGEPAAQEIYVVDCLAVDVRSLIEALAAHPQLVAHAPRQDLQLFASRFGVAMPQVFDLQIGAAFVGLGDQVGYARLVGGLLGVELAKDLQWTDWARRPLSEAHLAYAVADVAYLLPLHRELSRRLGARAQWVRVESARIAELARLAAQVPLEDAWEDVSGAGALPPRQLAAVSALAQWRLAKARVVDKPLGHVLSDKVIVELARRPPRDVAALSRRVQSADALEHAAELLAAMVASESAEPPALPARKLPLGARGDAWVTGLLLIVELIATQEHIAPRFLATRAEVEALARAYDLRGEAGLAAHPVMSGWRRQLLGELCAGWLRGELAIVSDAREGSAASVRLERRQPEPAAAPAAESLDPAAEAPKPGLIEPT